MDRLDMEELYQKAGGIFRFTVLVQKRIKELKAGAPKLVELETNDLKRLVYQEIIEEKIKLVPYENKEGELSELEEDNVKRIFEKRNTDYLSTLT